VFNASNAQIGKEEYIGTIVYQGDVLTSMGTAEGRVEFVNGGAAKYQYYLRDHQGGIRVVFEQGDNGLAKLVQENHFYPFGMNISGLTTGDSKYRFGGKELQDDLDLMWYDFHARNYDAQLGRWFNIDPLAENYVAHSPYNFCLNNPITLTDPSGMAPEYNIEFGRDMARKGISPSMSARMFFQLSRSENGDLSDLIGSLGFDSRKIFFYNPKDDIYYDDSGHEVSKSYLAKYYMRTNIITIVINDIRIGNYRGPLLISGYIRNGVKYEYPDNPVVFSRETLFGIIKNPSGQGGENFSLASMYGRFQVGGTNPMVINASTIDFSGTNQRELGLDKIRKGQSLDPVNLFNAGINSNSLAFGNLKMTRVSDTQFSIADNMFNFDFPPGTTWKRDAGTVLGAAINYNLMISPAAALVPLIFGGPYNVIFKGTVTIPK
jgi:RHS repeat-associated protein